MAGLGYKDDQREPTDEREREREREREINSVIINLSLPFHPSCGEKEQLTVIICNEKKERT